MKKFILLAVAAASTASSVFAGSCRIAPVRPPVVCPPVHPPVVCPPVHPPVRPPVVCPPIHPPICPPDPCYIKPVCRVLPPPPPPVCPPVHPPCRITVCPVPHQPICPPEPCRITCTPVTPPPCETVCIPTCRIRVCELPPPPVCEKPACTCHKPCSCKKTIQVCTIRVCEHPVQPAHPVIPPAAHHYPTGPQTPVAPQLPQPPVNAPQVQAGQQVTIDGASFGFQPGTVVLNVGGMQLQANVTSWTNNEVRAILPALPLTAAANATVSVIAPSGQTTQQLAVTLVADSTLVAQR